MSDSNSNANTSDANTSDVNTKTAVDDLVNIDDISGDLTKCYQIQVDKDGIPKPVYIGSYKDIPLVTHTTVLYDQSKEAMKNKPNNEKPGKNKYRIHVVTYVLPEDAIQNKIYKIVGLIVQKNEDTESLVSLDMRYNTSNKKYEFIFCDHKTDEVTVVKSIKFPGADNVLKSIMDQIFEEPLKSVLLK